MSTAQTAARGNGWRVLGAAPAMIGSLLLLVFLTGGLGPWAPVVVLAWLGIGLLILTRFGEAAAARLLCRFQKPAPAQAASLGPVLFTVLNRCGLSPNAVDLYVVRGTDRNAYATGKRSIALTTRLITDHDRGTISDRALGSIVCHEVGHLVTRSVRLAPMTTWLASPWRSTYRLGARLVLPIAARQPRFLLALVVTAAFTIAIAQGIQEHQWGSVALLAGIAVSALAAPTIDAAASRAGEYEADQFAARIGYGNDLSRALLDIDLAGHPLAPVTDARLRASAELVGLADPGVSCRRRPTESVQRRARTMQSLRDRRRYRVGDFLPRLSCSCRPTRWRSG